MIHTNDLTRWRAKLDQIDAAAASDQEFTSSLSSEEGLRRARNAEMRALIDKFIGDGDLQTSVKE